MPIYSDVVASRIEKYRAQLERGDGNDSDIDTAILKYVICQLVDAAFGGGGGGGTSTSATTIAQGINQSTDIDTIVARLTDIDANQINQSSVRAAIDSSVNIDTILARLLSIDGKAIGQSDIVAAIQSAADIDAIILALNQISTNSGYPVGARTIAQSQSVSIASDQRVPIDNQRINGSAIATGIGVSDAGTQRMGLSSDSIVAVKSTAVPIAQFTTTLSAGGTGSYLIPANAKSVTICINSGSLVHYTEDGTAPTTANCWFGGGTKEIWDAQIPAGSTLNLLAVATATISIQVRV